MKYAYFYGFLKSFFDIDRPIGKSTANFVFPVETRLKWGLAIDLYLVM